MRSRGASASLRMWLESSRVAPPARSSRTHSRNVSSMSGSRPLVGSSSRKSSTREASAATSATFCRLPLEYDRAFFVGSRSNSSRSSSRRARVVAALQPPEQVDRLAAGEARPQRDVAGHVREPRVQRARPATGPARAPARCRRRPVPSPAARARSVVFPAPFGPRKPCTSPRATCRSSPSRAWSSRSSCHARMSMTGVVAHAVLPTPPGGANGGVVVPACGRRHRRGNPRDSPVGAPSVRPSGARPGRAPEEDVMAARSPRRCPRALAAEPPARRTLPPDPGLPAPHPRTPAAAPGPHRCARPRPRRPSRRPPVTARPSQASADLASLGRPRLGSPSRPPTTRRPARPASTLQGRDVWRVHDGDAEHSVGVRGRLRAEPGRCPSPATGCSSPASPHDPVIEAVLPVVRRSRASRPGSARSSRSSRRTSTSCSSAPRALAQRPTPRARAHGGVGVGRDAGRRRHEVRPAADDVAETLDEVRGVAIGVEVLAVSSYDGDGLDEVRALIPPGRDRCGHRPVGRRQVDARERARRPRGARDDGGSQDNRGVHTTSARTSCRCRTAGSCSTPPACASSCCGRTTTRSRRRSPMSTRSPGCRFTDCGHHAEPGCAVLAAVESGALDEARLESWRKLQRELAHLARKQDARLASEERRRWAQLTREGRSRSRH